MNMATIGPRVIGRGHSLRIGALGAALIITLASGCPAGSDGPQDEPPQPALEAEVTNLSGDVVGLGNNVTLSWQNAPVGDYSNVIVGYSR